MPLQLWNLWLALFSIGGSLVTSKALYDEISTKGLVCKCYCTVALSIAQYFSLVHTRRRVLPGH